MSIVWGSHTDGNDWDDTHDGFPCSPSTWRESEYVSRWISPTKNSDREGYTGNPSSFVDIDDPRFAAAQRRYSEQCREGFRKNMEMVGRLVYDGVVMPTGGMLERIVGKLKKIASGNP